MAKNKVKKKKAYAVPVVSKEVPDSPLKKWWLWAIIGGLMIIVTFLLWKNTMTTDKVVSWGSDYMNNQNYTTANNIYSKFIGRFPDNPKINLGKAISGFMIVNQSIDNKKLAERENEILEDFNRFAEKNVDKKSDPVNGKYLAKHSVTINDKFDKVDLEYMTQVLSLSTCVRKQFQTESENNLFDMLCWFRRQIIQTSDVCASTESILSAQGNAASLSAAFLQLVQQMGYSGVVIEFNNVENTESVAIACIKSGEQWLYFDVANCIQLNLGEVGMQVALDKIISNPEILKKHYPEKYHNLFTNELSELRKAYLVASTYSMSNKMINLQSYLSEIWNKSPKFSYSISEKLDKLFESYGLPDDISEFPFTLKKLALTVDVYNPDLEAYNNNREMDYGNILYDAKLSHFAKGRMLFLKGDFSGSRLEYKKASKVENLSADVINAIKYFRGVTWFHEALESKGGDITRNLNKAMEQFEEYLEYKDGNLLFVENAKLFIGLVYMEQKEFSTAEKYFNEVPTESLKEIYLKKLKEKMENK